MGGGSTGCYEKADDDRGSTYNSKDDEDQTDSGLEGRGKWQGRVSVSAYRPEVQTLVLKQKTNELTLTQYQPSLLSYHSD